MQKMTPKERAQAVEIIMAEGRYGMTKTEAARYLATMTATGATLHRVYERQCNGHQKPNGDWDEAASNADDRLEEKLEARLREVFKVAGLGLYLNGDPRGNPVGILTPKTGRYNTMGGREDGWRL